MQGEHQGKRLPLHGDRGSELVGALTGTKKYPGFGPGQQLSFSCGFRIGRGADEILVGVETVDTATVDECEVGDIDRVEGVQGLERRIVSSQVFYGRG